MTMQEFMEGILNNAIDNGPMDLDTARTDLENFRRDGWELPEGITPESYMDAWNEVAEK